MRIIHTRLWYELLAKINRHRTRPQANEYRYTYIEREIANAECAQRQIHSTVRSDDHDDARCACFTVSMRKQQQKNKWMFVIFSAQRTNNRTVKKQVRKENRKENVRSRKEWCLVIFCVRCRRLCWANWCANDGSVNELVECAKLRWNEYAQGWEKQCMEYTDGESIKENDWERQTWKSSVSELECARWMKESGIWYSSLCAGSRRSRENSPLRDSHASRDYARSRRAIHDCLISEQSHKTYRNEKKNINIWLHRRPIKSMLLLDIKLPSKFHVSIRNRNRNIGHGTI